MIAHYGYRDGSGEFFVVIDTDKCMLCRNGECVPACDAGVLERITDDYDEIVCAVKEEFRNKLKYMCAPCHPADRSFGPKCVSRCMSRAIRLTW